MATASLPSAYHSESSATLATALVPPQTQVDATFENGTQDVDDQKPQIADHFEVLGNPEYIEKYKKFEADCTRRLMAKYFSQKNFYRGNIFDETTMIDSETILSRRWPCTWSFADPFNAFSDQSNVGSNSKAEIPTNISNGKFPLKKNC